MQARPSLVLISYNEISYHPKSREAKEGLQTGQNDMCRKDSLLTGD